ncbi:MAG: AIR synthase-related protein [Patescibacteria group bacterium]
MSTYKQAGVDIKLGDQASKILYEAAKLTWKNRKGLGKIFSPHKSFSGIRVINVSGLPRDSVMCMGFDGIGTKVEISQRLHRYDTIAYDLLAMTCDDAVMAGGEPVLVGSVLDVNTLKGNMNALRQLARGYVNAAKDANVAIINGELAELGHHVGGYGKFNYSWSSTVVWFAKSDRLFDGSKIKLGQALVALKEDGFRSNGISLVRKVLSKQKSNDMWQRALQPSRIYSRAVVEMFGGYDKKPKAQVSGVAHITGGGIPGKLGRVLSKAGIGAVINNPFNPPAVMKYCINKGKISLREAYHTWNMGNGMIIITSEPEKVMSIAKKHNISSKIIGETVKKTSINIKDLSF